MKLLSTLLIACVVSAVKATSLALTAGTDGFVYVSGALNGAVQGGTATSSLRCVYYYNGDIFNGSSTPTYTGAAWPVVELPVGITTSITAPSTLVSRVTVANNVPVVRINGLPLYQFQADTSMSGCTGNNFGFVVVNAADGSSGGTQTATPVNVVGNSNTAITVSSSSSPSPTPSPMYQMASPPPPPALTLPLAPVGGNGALTISTGADGNIYVTNANAILTPGGPALAITRCVYFYHNDTMTMSTTPTFIGPDWPWVELKPTQNTMTAPSAITSKVSVDALTSTVRINGLPIYQFLGDTTGCSTDPDFVAVKANGLASFGGVMVTALPTSAQNSAAVTVSYQNQLNAPSPSSSNNSVAAWVVPVAVVLGVVSAIFIAVIVYWLCTKPRQPRMQPRARF